MNIIKGDKLNSILHNSEFALNSFYKEFDAELFDKPGRFILEFSFPTSQNLSGTGLPTDGDTHTAILKQEVKKRGGLLRSVKEYLEFEVISDDSDEFEPTTFYVPSEELIPVLLGATEGEGEECFDIEMLGDTVGLVGNESIGRQLAKTTQKRTKERGLDRLKPKEYYDKEFGSRTDEEWLLNKKAKAAINEHGTGEGSGNALKYYSKIIELNPSNAYAFFNRGLALLDYWSYKQHFYMFDDRPVAEKEAEKRKREQQYRLEAEADFQKAMELHPYLLNDYERLRKEGRI